ncbi:hypothetical protein [Streptomyces sp. NPDC020141]|uniref:hypothetical protein n=1 Tax=Streptomyces sp. NPDC020141 TaxID=3365065 RepID=UPI0037BBA422
MNRATRWAGTSLCCAHAAAMAATAAEVLLEPTPSWWSWARTASWALTGALLIAWALLRAAQKRRLRGLTRSEDDDDFGDEFPEEPTRYDQAA